MQTTKVHIAIASPHGIGFRGGTSSTAMNSSSTGLTQRMHQSAKSTIHVVVLLMMTLLYGTVVGLGYDCGPWQHAPIINLKISSAGGGKWHIEVITLRHNLYYKYNYVCGHKKIRWYRCTFVFYRYDSVGGRGRSAQDTQTTLPCTFQPARLREKYTKPPSVLLRQPKMFHHSPRRGTVVQQTGKQRVRDR
ncbi:ORF22 [Plodia interpunctella granulovirus]|uniref:ORF22 n=1 Tax=Plodia interpunctella granulovirus TaxID=262175 RepID=A0A1L5JGY3_9BBAC|nr:ORF22 [Plodia interpunctella granulovirus]APO13906.1 ORF22 [Plodia interpunctella granulovirus]